MTAAQWTKVKEILDAALDLPPDDRDAFLTTACGDDQPLLLEVKSLLENFDEAGPFLQSSCSSASITDSESSQQPTFAPEQIIAGRFKVLRFMAHGGMGEVYEATDLELSQRIALKIVRPDMLSDQTIARFRQEVACARRITHPNVCRVFDLEQWTCPESQKEVFFLTMEFLDGETLRDRLTRQGRFTVAESLPIISQIAQALAASHAAGVVHRDLKPSNVILSTSATLEGAPRAVVTDFGVARMSTPYGSNHSSSDTLTGHGQMVGTTAYMAPEQAEGKEVTSTTDLYALGLIMYEMLAGQKPFSETTPFKGLIERSKSVPVSPRVHAKEVGSRLESLVLGCLAVDPAERIQQAQVLVKEIEELQADPARASQVFVVPSALVSQLSLAVLPFINLGRDPENEYFSDGLTEELMGALAKIEGLRVVARNSSFRYRRTALEVQEIARQLNVNALLEGRVRQSGQRLRVSVRLLDGTTGQYIWTERYDRRMDDLFDIQEEIANTIARELRMQLKTAPGNGSAKYKTPNREAHDFFLKGLYFSNKRTASSLQKAAENYQSAIALDPAFAPALASLANCYLAQGIYGNEPPDQAFLRAKDFVEQALKTNPNLPEAHCISGIIQSLFDRDLAKADLSFQRALELDSNCVAAHQCYATTCLMFQGRFREVHDQLQLAHELDPLSLLVKTAIGSAFYHERRYQEATRELLTVVEMEERFGFGHYALGQVYEKQAMYPEAIAALQRAVELTERSALSLAMLGRVFAIAGRTKEARLLLADLEGLAATRYISPVHFACLLSGFDETSLVLDFLEKAIDVRAPEVISIGTWPVFDPLRKESRFLDLCQAIGVPNAA